MNLDDAINVCVQIGLSADNKIIHNYSNNQFEVSGINRQTPQFWYAYCRSINKQEIISLFKGLVIVERELNLIGGSVAANIWVLSFLQGAGPSQKIYCDHAEIRSLIDWAFSNRGRNEYTPLGKMAFGKTYDEYLESRKRRAIEKAQAAHLREANEKIRKLEKQKEKEEHQRRAAEIFETRKHIIDIIQPMNQIQRLEWLASTELPVRLAPVEFFNIEDLCNSYNGTPSFSDLRKKLHSFNGHWKYLLDAISSKETHSGDGQCVPLRDSDRLRRE